MEKTKAAAPPMVDLLGDEIDCTPNAQDIEFGQFQEAISPYVLAFDFH